MEQRSLFWLAAIAAATLATLTVILCSKAGAVLLVAALESRAVPFPSPHQATNAKAIVVLGGGTERDWHAARLQRETGLPLLVSGVEATAMAKKITQQWATPIEWMEESSQTTEENGDFSSKILKQHGIRRILLVTDAHHMLRAQIIFRHDGMEVIPVPVTFTKHQKLSMADFLPSSEGIKQSRSARHELLGLLWFWVSTLI
jgi:uncharacterized SAM-binding protein YcdF (DUF218 family)